MTEQTIEQLREELADARRVGLSYLRRLATKHKEELAQAQTEIARVNKISDGYAAGWADACGARDALESNRDFWLEKCWTAEAERDKMRKEAQEQSDLVQRDWLSPCQKAGLESLVKTLRGRLKHADDIRDFWIKEHDDLLQTIRREHQVAKATMVELKRVHRTAHEEAEGLRLQLADARRVARLWFRRAHDIVVVEVEGKEFVEALQAQRALRQVAEANDRASRKMLARQCDMARTAETEAMKAKRELAEAEARLARAHWLSPDEAAAVSEWTRWGKEERSHVQERLATLEDAEQRHQATIDELEQRLTRMRKRLAQALLEAHTHSKAADELAQTGRTERAEKREAETKAENREAQLTLEVGRSNSLRHAYHLVEQRAERAEALVELIALSKKVPSEHAEALAALVTPGLVELLERLAEEVNALYGRTVGIEFHRSVWATQLHADDKTARALAAQIREALDDSQA